MSGFAPEKEIKKVLIYQNLNIVRFCSSERNKKILINYLSISELKRLVFQHLSNVITY